MELNFLPESLETVCKDVEGESLLRDEIIALYDPIGRPFGSTGLSDEK